MCGNVFCDVTARAGSVSRRLDDNRFRAAGKGRSHPGPQGLSGLSYLPRRGIAMRRVDWGGLRRSSEFSQHGPDSIEPSANRAAGTRGFKSRRRLVRAQRMSREIWRPVRFC